MGDLEAGKPFENQSSLETLNINDALIITPPELASDIHENGIVLSGGTALLAGLREYIEKKINIPVRLAPDPVASVANGMQNYIKTHR